MNFDQIRPDLEVLEAQVDSRSISHLIIPPDDELLIVDDDISFGNYAKLLLSDKGYRVWRADSLDRVESILDERSDLRVIVLSLDLSAESGLALAERLHQDHPGRYFIVALTNCPSMFVAEKALGTGIFYYLTKPTEGQSANLCFAVARAFEASAESDVADKRSGGHRDLIFLSCASEDLDRVSLLHHHLTKARFSPWLYSKDLYPGQQWQDKIAEAIKASAFFLFFLSNVAIAKTGFIHREVKQALALQDELPESKIFLIPVRLENCPLPEALRHLVCADLFAADGYRKLLNALRIDHRAGARESDRRSSKRENCCVRSVLD